MAILIRADVREGDLPGERQRSSLLNDVTSYKAIFQAASAVYDYCGKGLHLPGWAQVGMFHEIIRMQQTPCYNPDANDRYAKIRQGDNGGIAVAFWTVGSQMDRRYQNVNNIALPNITLPTETA